MFVGSACATPRHLLRALHALNSAPAGVQLIHFLTDGAAIGLALGAIVVATRASTEGARTYGLFRLEILASLANALLLFAVAGYVLVEALLRLSADRPVGST